MERGFWALPWVLALLGTAGLCLYFVEEMSLLLSRIVQHLDKGLFSFSPTAASGIALWVEMGSRASTLVR